MNETSRRDFLSFLPLAVAPLVCAIPDLPESRGDIHDRRLRVEGVAAEQVKTVTVSKVPCPDWPLQSLGAVTAQGNPEASGKTVFETGDHQITGGIWKCSPGTFDLTFTWDEMAMLLEGELIIVESSGHKVRILPGDFFFVPRGAKTRWIVVKSLKKVFFSRE